MGKIQDRVCENCKHLELSLWVDSPCTSCEIGPNQNWEPEKEDFIPEWMKNDKNDKKD